MAKVSLKGDIAQTQNISMDIRQDMNMRQHYDREVERWIQSLKEQLTRTEQSLEETRKGTHIRY